MAPTTKDLFQVSSAIGKSLAAEAAASAHAGPTTGPEWVDWFAETVASVHGLEVEVEHEENGIAKVIYPAAKQTLIMMAGEGDHPACLTFLFPESISSMAMITILTGIGCAMADASQSTIQ